MNPLDQALTNVIQNLIRINDGESGRNVSISREDTSCSFFEDPCENLASETDGNTENSDSSTTSKMNSCNGNLRSWRPTSESRCSLPTTQTLKRTTTSVDLPSAIDNGRSSESSSTVTECTLKPRDGETLKLESIPSSAVSRVATTANTTSTMSVFSIGPLPTSAVSSSSIKSVQFSNPLIVGPSNRFFAPMFGAAAAESNNFTNNLAASSSMTSSSQEEEPMNGKEQRSPRSIESITDSDSISIDSSSSLDTVREFPMTDHGSTSFTSISKEELQESATCSQKESAVTSTKIRTPEEVLATRADRLKRLEEQADWLVKKMNATSKRSTALCTRLEELHEAYGEPPVPPPMPDVLPSRRLPSILLNLPRQVRARNYPVDCDELCRRPFFIRFFSQILESPSARGTEDIEDESSDAAKNDTSSNANAAC